VFLLTRLIDLAIQQLPGNEVNNSGKPENQALLGLSPAYHLPAGRQGRHNGANIRKINNEQ